MMIHVVVAPAKPVFKRILVIGALSLLLFGKTHGVEAIPGQKTPGMVLDGQKA